VQPGCGAASAVLIASHFPNKMRGTLLASFFATSVLGSVLGVLLGGLIATRWGWHAALGIVGVPGLLLALLYLRVRDYPDPPSDAAQSLTAHAWLREARDNL
jgi:MFS family permease